MAAWNQSLCGLAPSISRLGVNGAADLPTTPAYTLQTAHPMAVRPILLRHPIVITRTEWCRNVNLLPIDYAVRPRLRDRLTLSGLTLLRKPWASGEQSSRLLYRYLCRQSHFHEVHQSLRSDFIPHGTLPYHLSHPRVEKIRSFGERLEPR